MLHIFTRSTSTFLSLCIPDASVNCGEATQYRYLKKKKKSLMKTVGRLIVSSSLLIKPSAEFWNVKLWIVIQKIISVGVFSPCLSLKMWINVWFSLWNFCHYYICPVWSFWHKIFLLGFIIVICSMLSEKKLTEVWSIIYYTEFIYLFSLKYSVGHVN